MIYIDVSHDLYTSHTLVLGLWSPLKQLEWGISPAPLPQPFEAVETDNFGGESYLVHQYSSSIHTEKLDFRGWCKWVSYIVLLQIKKGHIWVVVITIWQLPGRKGPTGTGQPHL